MKILFFTPTAELGASSRYRVYQYKNSLESEGHTCTIKPLLSNELYGLWKSKKKIKLIAILPALFIKRLQQSLSAFKYDLVIIHRDVFPFGPMFFEKIIRKLNKNIIIDIDDSVFTSEIEEIGSNQKFIYKLKYGKRFYTGFKIARMVICGNEFLQKNVNLVNPNTVIVPTVVDTNNIKPKSGTKDSNYITIGWVGNPGNSEYLKQLSNVLNNINNIGLKKRVKLKFIGANEGIKDYFNNIEIEVNSWSLDNEYDMLRECDIGIMPLMDSTWSKGKCGLKLLQYMAVGIPVIASPVGVNEKIVIDNYNGYLAANEREWIEKLVLLMNDEEEMVRLGRNGRSFVEKYYSLDGWAEKLNNILCNLS
jgi:glycosyltransferase involved in cell wall biosynthesis